MFFISLAGQVEYKVGVGPWARVGRRGMVPSSDVIPGNLPVRGSIVRIVTPEIATPVCGLVRNDMRFLSAVHHLAGDR